MLGFLFYVKFIVYEMFEILETIWLYFHQGMPKKSYVLIQFTQAF